MHKSERLFKPQRINTIKLLTRIVLIYIFITLPVLSQVELDVETGAAFSGYNDVRIPGEGGTLFSLSEELSADPSFYFRFRVFYEISKRHNLGLLLAPLSINSTGKLNRELLFKGKSFPANTTLKGTYQFNSYRFIYRYDFLQKEKINLALGFTAKIRDAMIRIRGSDIESKKTNVGFVPILHFRLFWILNQKFNFLLDGDALAAPQGRAEDVLAALTMKVSDKISLKIGYRILEGGADNDEVYNFALVNYAAFGALLYF